jgi:hypothetical protein
MCRFFYLRGKQLQTEEIRQIQIITANQVFNSIQKKLKEHGIDLQFNQEANNGIPNK